MTVRTLLASAIALTACSTGFAAIALNPLSTFGGGDGLLAPGDVTWLTTDSNQRSMAYNRSTGNLLVVNGLSVRVVNGLSGTATGLLDVTGISGGDRALNTVGVASDGVIYGSNLRATSSSTAGYKIYRWGNEAAVPTTAYNADPLAGNRFGDDFDVIGSGVNTRLVAGMGNNATPTNDNSYIVFSTTDGAAYNSAYINHTSTALPGQGDFRLGITFTDSDTVLGLQGSKNLRVSDYDLATATAALAATGVLLDVNERPIDWAVVGGVPFLATVQSNSSLVRLYDLTNPAAPLLAGSANLTTTFAANGNGTGSVAFGDIVGNTATLYALNTNNGIQAFTFTVPEPTTLGAMGGMSVLTLRRRK
jgi:hypothetical protein